MMDTQNRKKALRMISYGMYIVTAKSEEEFAGSTVTWLSQASMTPPLVMMALEDESHTFKAVETSGAFVVNMLGTGQKDIAQRFFKHPHVENEKMHGIPFKSGVTGAPVLLDLPAYVECKVTDIVKRGDHFVVVGEVIEAGVNNDLAPLALKDTGWSYGG